MAHTLPIGDRLAQTTSDLKKAVLVTTMGIRVGDQLKSIGYINSFSRTHSRQNFHMKQLEPYVNGTFGGSAAEIDFNKSDYFPGETVEVAPGVLADEAIAIERYTLYTSTMFEAFMRAGGGGTIQDGIGDSNINNAEQVTRYVNLLQQIKPIDVYEVYISPIDKKVIWGIMYLDCWFKDMGRNVKVGTDNIINETASLDVTKTRQYFG